jgi:2-C-methyl-D-erythritol 2,4-cyclodiphosphate synthase
MIPFRIGIGYDVHQLVEGRKLMIGGVEIPYERGLLGHSDADVLLHAIADAILGALGLGDIGRHFPDTDDRYKGISSVTLLQEVWKLARTNGYRLGNLDCVLLAQKPKIAPYIEAMKTTIADVLDAQVTQINIKATTTEKLGFVGREEGMAAEAVVLLISDVV